MFEVIKTEIGLTPRDEVRLVKWKKLNAFKRVLTVVCNFFTLTNTAISVAEKCLNINIGPIVVFQKYSSWVIRSCRCDIR